MDQFVRMYVVLQSLEATSTGFCSVRTEGVVRSIFDNLVFAIIKPLSKF